MATKTKILIGILIFVAVLILGGLIWSIFYQMDFEPAYDARLAADMKYAIRNKANTLYDEEKSYLNLDCDYDNETKAVCDYIARIVGAKPTIHKSEKEYCAYTKLTKGGYFCIDSTGFADKITVNPGQENYCDGTTFTCTGEKVEGETADWKTYRNEEYGFEVKYPQNLCIREEGRLYLLVGFMDCEAVEKPKLYAPKIIIDISVVTTELSPREWLKQVGTEEDLRDKPLSFWSEKCPQLCLYSNISEIKNIFINNIPALQFNAWLVTTDGIVVLIKKPPKTIIEITNFHTEIGREDFSDKIFNQMLSTFRFLE